VQRVQMSLERLAELGQAAHVVLPPNLHEVQGPLLLTASLAASCRRVCVLLRL
jgi:hypothetical protein